MKGHQNVSLPDAMIQLVDGRRGEATKRSTFVQVLLKRALDADLDKTPPKTA